jgi:16S rRNA (guanine527-N7)-methyltransferase
VTTRELLDAELDRLRLDPPSDARNRLVTYINELERWNRTINLTSLHGAVLVRRLIAEPIWIGQQIEMSGTLLDVGSGNGAPAIPLSLTRFWTEAHLIEARTKRAAFLRNVVAMLGLKQIFIHRLRVEEASDLPTGFDWITLQAVSPTRELLQTLQRVAGKTTRIVWITSGQTSPRSADRHLTIPGSETEVWIFRLDHS